MSFKLDPSPRSTEISLVDQEPPRSFWHSRGYMPHFDSPQAIQHVTFHLADSLPHEVVERLRKEVEKLPPQRRDKQLRVRLENWIDAGHGSCVLAQGELAALVQDTLLHFDSIRDRLFAWVIMPNHVHVLFQPYEGWTMAKIVASWKSYTGRRISAARGMEEGKVWQREYWDRYIRDQNHLLDARAYIHQNPVKAGLVADAENWEWSSAPFGEP